MSSNNTHPDCIACQEALAAAGVLDDPVSALDDECRIHLVGCKECQTFAADIRAVASLISREELPEASNELVERTVFAVKQEMAELDRAQRDIQRAVHWRLALAGLAALPVIVGLNGLLGYLGYSALGWFSATASQLFVYLLVASTMLGLSILYGAMPVFAKLAVDLRRPMFAVVAADAPMPPSFTNDVYPGERS